MFAHLWHLLDLAIAAAAATVSINSESMEYPLSEVESSERTRGAKLASTDDIEGKECCQRKRPARTDVNPFYETSCM